jgi:monothiol glutaredoxin
MPAAGAKAYNCAVTAAMDSAGSLLDDGLHTVKAGERNMPVLERIQAELDSHPMVLFMKGTPEYPMCGYSSSAVQALLSAGADQLRAINVLEEPEIRANLPRFSNWPTFPQLFIHGELIGGCDITLELHESGELARIVAEALPR